MKLLSVFILAAALQVSAKGHSQTITFSGKDVSLKKVFNAIESQTDYVFFYDAGMLSNAKAVTLDIKNGPLEIVLKEIFDNQPFTWSIVNKTITILRKEDGGIDHDKALLSHPPIDIKGRVTNENGEPLAGANVALKGTNQGAITDNNGYYKLENIIEGTYTLEISYVGYATKTTTIKVSEGGKLMFDIKLVPSLVNLDEMTVTSTLSKRAIRAYPATIAVIKQEDLKNRNLNNITNVLEAIPGIVITPGSEQYNSGSNRQPFNVLIRGTNAGAPIKYLIDGIEIVSEGVSGSILQTLDPNSIENIEILKGPMSSTLYGNGAAGGIISITTKKGRIGKTNINFKTMFTQYANDYADYNGYNQNYSVNISGGAEQFNYILGAGYNLYPTTKLTDTNNGIDDKTWSYTAKVTGSVKNIAADLSLQYGNENSGTGDVTPSMNKYRSSLGLSLIPVFPPSDSRNSQRNFLTSLHLTHTITNNCYQDLTIGYNIVNSASNSYTPSSYDGTYNSYEFLFSKINARYFVFYDHPWSAVLKTSITAGFEYNGYESHSMNINSTSSLSNFFAVYTPATEGAAFFTKSPYSSTGYFAEAVTGLKNDLFLTTGIRYDVNPAYGDNIKGYTQPRVGLTYIIEQGAFKIKPRIVWGVSSTPPEPTYKITTVTTSPYYTIINVGNSQIKPQRSEGYEFGSDIFYGSNYSLNITYYDQKIKDMIKSSQVIDFNTSPTTYYYYNYNVANAVNKGLELSAKAILKPFTLELSYTQITSKWGDKVGQTSTPVIYPHAPSFNIPKKSFFAGVAYKIPSMLSWTEKGGRVSLEWRYNGSAYNLDDISYNLATDAWTNAPDPKPAYPDYLNYLTWMKGYSYFNLRGDYSITNYATLYIDVQNLLDKQGSLNGQSLNQFPGRRINFGFNINFN